MEVAVKRFWRKETGSTVSCLAPQATSLLGRGADDQEGHTSNGTMKGGVVGVGL